MNEATEATAPTSSAPTTSVLSLRLPPDQFGRLDELASQGNLGSRSNFVAQLIARLDAIVGNSPYDVRKLTYDPNIVIEKPQVALPLDGIPQGT